MMGRKKMAGMACGVIMTGSLMLGACGTYAAGGRAEALATPKEAAECVMESLKGLNLEQFNACTDNYVATYHNWIGIPVECEYRVFNELLQPGVKLGKRKKRYEYSRRLSEKMMENLTWEIEEVKESGSRAEIIMEITNLDMSEVMGKYEIYLLEDMTSGAGLGLRQLFFDLSHIMEGEGGLLSIVEACDAEDMITIRGTVTAYEEGGGWKIHLDDAFINAFMGNINADTYSEEIEERIEELYDRQEEKMEEWEAEISGKADRWAERFEEWMEW